MNDNRPGGALDSTVQAASHVQPTTPAPALDVDLSGFVVPTADAMPEETIPRIIVLSAANPFLPLLPRDAARRRAVILSVDNDVILVESLNLAQQLAAAVAGGAAAASLGLGAYLPKGVALPLESRDLMYAVATTYNVTTSGGASATTVGSVTSPTAGQTITSQALAAGTYAVGWSAQLSGTLGAGDANNFALKLAATQLAQSLNAAAAATYPQPSQTVVVPAGGATLAIAAIGAGTVGAVYGAQLTVTPLTQIAAGSSRVSLIVERYANTGAV